MRRKRIEAFTLVELLAVIGILGIICLIATPIALGIMEETKKDVFHTSVLSLVNATKMDIGNKYYEDEFLYTLEDGVIDNIEFPVSNAEGMYGMIEYDENSKVQYAVHNEKYCVKKMDYMKKAKIFNYEGVCNFSTSEKCFAFSDGTITDYYDYEDNNKNNDICPRKVIIPETINGQVVTKIDVSAFEEKELTRVEFPSTIKTIANYAFSNNKISGKLDLSHLIQLTGLGWNSFQNNEIESIKFPASDLKSIGNYAFQNNKLIGELDLSHLTQLTGLGRCSFQNNEITSVKLPSSINSIGWYAFSYNKIEGTLDLSHLTQLTGLGCNSFQNNEITSVKLPDSLTSIDSGVFMENKISGELDLSNCTNLTSISANAFIGNSTKTSNQITSIKLPTSIKTIGGHAFRYNKIKNLDLSNCNNLTTIDSYAFRDNEIASIKLSSSIQTIKENAFAYNRLTGELDLSNCASLTKIDVGVFTGTANGSTNRITSVKLPSSLESLGDSFNDNAISGELDLSNLTKLTSIGGFSGNKITTLKLPTGITTINRAAFSRNKLSGELDLSNCTNLTTIGTYAFLGLRQGNSDEYLNQITSVNFPNSIVTIENHAFQHTNLQGELDLSHLTDLTTIKEAAFYNNQLTSVKLPSNITSIGYEAFINNRLTSVTFYGRSDLTGVNIGGNAWGWASGYNANNNIYFINE